MRDAVSDPELMARWLRMYRQPDGKALFLAARLRKQGSKVMLQLLRKGVSATEVTDAYTRQSPLQLAVRHDLRGVVEFLWQRDDVRSPHHLEAATKALILASSFGHVACIRELLHPPSPLTANTRTSNGRLPLHQAAEDGQLESLKVSESDCV